MNASHIKNCIRALFLAAFFSAIGPVGVTAQSAANIAKWRKAAEQGVAYAQYNLGVMYTSGQGVPKDAKLAVQSFRRAAEQGFADAQNNLGVMYASGQGVPKDDKIAVQWYRRAAEQGDAKAQSNLGLMYWKGKGVPQDLVQAYKWTYLATAQSGLSTRYRDLIAKRMTSVQFAEAQRLAREWKPKN
jgi:TPR repeat protein